MKVSTSILQRGSTLTEPAKTNRRPLLFMRWLFALLLFTTAATNAQVVSITNPGNTTPALSATYGSLALAITDVNSRTAISGPVTITLNTGNAQTAPSGGYSITAIPSGASATNKFVFEGSGNTITAFGGQTSGNINDAIFKLVGADFITIQNFVMQENAANVTTATATNNMTEFGVALFYASATNGAQNNIIQNCTISLNRTYLNTFGIYSNTRTTATSMGTAADASSAAGANSGNKVYGNTISNVNYGIVFIGTSTAAAFETGNDIGGVAAGTGNTITNWGGGASASTYLSLTGNNYCIFSNHQINDNISFNNITSATLATAVTEGGILKNYSTTSPTSGTITTTINNNTVTILNNSTGTSAGSVIGINSQGLTPLLSTATISMNNNTVQNCVLGGSTATSAGLTAITNLSLPGTLNMNGNNVINNAITATSSTSGTIAGITNSGAAGTVNMNSNIIRGFTSTATSGQVQGITSSGAVVTALNINSNQFGNATGGFFSTLTATSGGLFEISTSTAASTCALTIQSNDIRGTVYNTAASAAQSYISNAAVTLSQNISSNTFTNLVVNTTGSVTFISNSVTAPAAGFKIINGNNIVTGYNKTGAGGTIALYTDGGSSTSTTAHQNNNNNFSNITVTGATIITGWFNNDGTGSTPAKTITGNTFSNWTCGTGSVIVLQSNFGGNNNVSSNTISGITGQSTINGILIGASGTIATSTIATNSVTGLSSTGSGAAVTGITTSLPTTTATNINNNIVSGLSSTAAVAVVGISTTGAATTTNIFKNSICDISGNNAGSTVNGLLVSAGTTITIHNNRIGDLRTTAANAANPLSGINITGGSTVNAYYNTVNLSASSTGGIFGSSAISVATTPTFDSRNNIFSNTSTANSTGLSVAYRRGATLTTYAATSDRNDLYASTLFSDGTNNITSLAAYKAFMSTRDQNSISALPAFLSTTCGNANFLKINSAVATQLESAGANVSGITNDFENEVRFGNAGYAGTGFAPDIGADEFNGTPAVACTGTPAASAISGVAAVCTGTGTTLTLSPAYGDLGITYAWFSGTTPGGPYPTALGTASTQATGNLTAPAYYICVVTCSNSGLSFTTPEKSVLINALPTITITPTPGSARICGTGSVSLAASGGVSYTWSPTTSPSTGTPVTASPTITTVYTASGTDANGCVGTGTQTVTVGPVVTVNTATATPSTICTGSTSVLNATASTSPVLGYTVASITPAAEAPTGTPVVLATGGTATPPAQSAQTTPLDDGYWDGIALPFSFTYYGVSYNTVRIGTNGNVQFGVIASTAGNPGNASWTSQTIPTAGGNLDNFIGGPWIDQDLSSTPFGTTRYFTNGTAPNRKFVVSFENVHVFNSTDNNTSQIILNENGTIDVLLLGGGLTSTATKAIGIENAGGTSGIAAPGRNSGTWTTLADEAWRFTPPSALTYSWAPATGLSPSATVANPTTPVLTSSTAYVVTVTEPVSGCTGTGNAPVTVNQNSTISLSSGAGTNAQTVTNGTAITPITYAIAGGGTGASLTAGSFPTGVTGSFSGGTYTISGTPTTNGTFNYTITTTGPCVNNALSGSITVNTACAVTGSAAVTNPNCFGGTGSATVTLAGAGSGAPGTYTVDGGGSVAYSTNPFTVTGLANGNHTIVATVTAGGCVSSSISANVVVPTQLVASSTAGTISCFGGSATVVVSATGGTAPYSGTGSFSHAAGSYSYTVTDANGCTSVATGTITEPTQLVASSTAGTIACNGGSTTVVVSATGGTAPYSGTGSFSHAAGSYSYTVTDANGCTSVATGTITEPTQLVASSTAGTIACNGGSTTVVVSATGGTAPYSGTGSFSHAAGSYSYTVTDANGCTSVTTGNISEPAALTGTATGTSVSCFGSTDGTATVTLSASTSGTYTLDGGSSAAYTSNPFTITGLAAGNHTIVATSAAGCVSSLIGVSVGSVAQLSGSGTTTPTSCGTPNSGSATITLSASTSGTYKVDGGSSVAYNTNPFTITGLSAGNHTIVATSAAGCVSSNIQVTVGGSATFTATASHTNLSQCGNLQNGTITITPAGGQAPYTYSWTGESGSNHTPFTAGNTATLTGLNYGYYNVTVTDAGGCGIVTISNIHVEIGYLVYITNSGSSSSACGNTGSIALYGSAGQAPYQWSLTSVTGPFQAGNTFTGLAAGTYTAYVQDANGCTNSKSITVAAAAAIVVSPNVVAASSCSNDGSIQIFRSGGFTPYTYSITSATGPWVTTNLFTGLAAGSYTAYVKDAAGCVGQAAANVTSGAALSLTVSKVNTSSCVNDGSIQVNVTGGVGPYTYSKSGLGGPFVAGNSFTSLPQGNYAMVAKDSKGCTGTTNVTIDVNTISVTSFITAASSCASTNGKIQIFRTGGVGPYTYSIDGGTYQAGNTFSNVAPGTYDLYVKDAKACLGVQSGVLVGPSCPRPTASVTKGQSSVQVLNDVLKAEAYPNPSSTEFTLVLSGNTKDKVSVIVTDIMGRKLYQVEGSNNTQYHFGRNFISGVYMVQVMQGTAKQSIKLVKE